MKMIINVKEGAVIVCSCHAISERTLERAIQAGHRTPGALARATKAGTSCGSCRCDLERLCREARAEPEAVAAK